MTAEATVIAAAVGHGDMRPGFGESMGPGKASAQTANSASSEVHAASAKVASTKVAATAAEVTAAAVATATTVAAAAASSEGSCWDRRAAQKDSGNSHNHGFFHH